MNESVDTEFSLLLWVMAAGLAVFAAHVAHGWVQMAYRGPNVLHQWRAVLLAAATFGSGICASTVLAMSAEALPFPIGYDPTQAAVLWLFSMVACVPAMTWAAATRSDWQLAGSGLLLALATAAVLVGWVDAAGFRPGVVWRPTVLGGAVMVIAACLGLAAWLAHSAARQASGRQAVWGLGAVLLVGLSLMGGHELVALAAGISGQQSSRHQGELPGAVLALASGGLMPLVLGVMTLDLALRRRARRSRHDGHSGFAPLRRRKRRHKVRTL